VGSNSRIGMSIFYLIGTACALIIFAVILRADSENTVIGLLIGAGTASLLAAKTGVIANFRRNYADNERMMDAAVLVGVLILAAFFHNDSFVLFLLATVLVYVIACLGLNLQFGYAGMLNFAGAAMLGVGGYTAAILGSYEFIPKLLLMPLGGLAAAVIGSIQLPPMLRTHGHYSAVVTIAFSLLFMTFLEVNPSFGGTQGLPVNGMSMFGFSFNENWRIGNFEIAFYFNYLILALAITVLVVVIVRRMERSWIGISLDAIRIDETAAKCFGMEISLWKAAAFTGGNFIIGMAGTFYALMLGYIAPTNFTFGDSLILVTIIILGGLGSIWGVLLTSAIIIVLPEKLQAIQEYRFLIYAIVVTAVLLFQPEGLLPRVPRVYYPRWRP
jgi:ABC-type branched-subunit amino acid transport system permease subunit